MRVVVVNCAYDPGVADPERTLDAFAALRGWAAGLRAAGADVQVVQRHGRDAVLERDGVPYHVVAAGGRGRPRLFDPLRAVVRRTVGLRPDVVHVNGLVFPLPTRLLRRGLGPGPTLVAQHHAEAPWRGWRGALQRWGLAGVDAYLFTADAQADPWRACGVVRPAQRVFEVMEGWSGLMPPARGEARRLPGAPALLWVGRLQAVKDPLTLLAGLDRLLDDVPTAHLTMVYGEADLLGEVEARLAARPRLRAAVTLVGRVPHDELGALYAGADYVVAASHREGSGFALSEALACGAVPIVTDIPSFAAMTDRGRLGGLWRPGDAEDFARVARAVFARPRRALSDAAIAHHRAQLSTDAIGRRALAAYAAARGGGRGA
jgi:glycosyltransferase involved in cell wall biosynthesis